MNISSIDRNVDIEKMVCPGGTDARFIREVIAKQIFKSYENDNYSHYFAFQLNLSAIGFMPMPNTPIKLHDNDEFIHADVYLNGINIYKKIISNLGNV